METRTSLLAVGKGKRAFRREVRGRIVQGNWLEVEGEEEAVMENDAANTVIPAPSPAITCLYHFSTCLPTASMCQHLPRASSGHGSLL